MCCEIVHFFANSISLFLGELVDVLVECFEAVDHIQDAILASLQPQQIGLDPGLGFGCSAPIQFAGQTPEVFLNVIEIHALLGVLEPICGQIPYPDGAIREDKYCFGS